MRFIEILDWKGKKIGEIKFDGKKIFPESMNDKNKNFLQEILDAILPSLPKDLSKAFNLIPERTAHYSRIFFGSIRETK